MDRCVNCRTPLDEDNTWDDYRGICIECQHEFYGEDTDDE